MCACGVCMSVCVTVSVDRICLSTFLKTLLTGWTCHPYCDAESDAPNMAADNGRWNEETLRGAVNSI